MKTRCSIYKIFDRPVKKVYLCIIFVRNESFAPTDISIITTYRCPMQCKMCNIWKNPTDPRLEIQPEELEILPHVKFINITGGEPFIREDLDKIVEVAFRKAPRVVISTSGWFEERVLELASKSPKIGIVSRVYPKRMMNYGEEPEVLIKG